MANETKMQRVCVYEMKNGEEIVEEIHAVEEEQHERAHAEREVASKGTFVKGYRFEWRDKK